MPKAEFPFLADWLAVSLRWLAVVGASVALAHNDGLNIFSWIVLAALLGWNIFITVLALFNRRLKYHRLLNVISDGVLSALLFVSSGGISGPAIWISVLALFSAAIYYEWRGIIIVGTLFIAFEVLWTIGASPSTAWTMYAYPTLLNIVLGVIAGLVAKQLLKGVRNNYQINVQQRQESDNTIKRHERDQMRAMYQLMETISENLNYKVVLDSAIGLSSVALGLPENHSHLVGAVLLNGAEGLEVGAARGFTQADMRQVFPGKNGLLADLFRTADYQLSNSPSSDPELSQLACLHHCRSMLVIPLRRALSNYGVMLYADPDPNFFTQERIEILEMVGRQAAIAIQNARLYHDLELEKDHIVEVQDEARKKLARDLHDGPTQTIAAIAMRLSVIRRMVNQDPHEADSELEIIEEMARRTTKEIRHMLFTLRPLVLETEGLISSINAIAQKNKDTYQQNVVVDVDPTIAMQLESANQTVIFYIIEEAVTNARKHAQADAITIRLQPTRASDIALLEIVDNGVGFDLDQVNSAYQNRGSLGMVNLRERSDLINGYLNVITSPGKGTRVQVYIPLTDAAVERMQKGRVPLKST